MRELNQHTSQVLARVRGGETVEVTDRGRLVARLVPVGDNVPLLERLVAEGRATPPTSSGGPIPFPPVLGDPTVDASATLARARDEESS